MGRSDVIVIQKGCFSGAQARSVLRRFVGAMGTWSGPADLLTNQHTFPAMKIPTPVELAGVA